VFFGVHFFGYVDIANNGAKTVGGFFLLWPLQKGGKSVFIRRKGTADKIRNVALGEMGNDGGQGVETTCVVRRTWLNADVVDNIVGKNAQVVGEVFDFLRRIVLGGNESDTRAEVVEIALFVGGQLPEQRLEDRAVFWNALLFREPFRAQDGLDVFIQEVCLCLINVFIQSESGQTTAISLPGGQVHAGLGGEISAVNRQSV